METLDPVIGRDVRERFANIGRDLFLSGAISSHGGNLSELRGNRIFITRRSAMLGRLGEDDVVWTQVAACERDEDCSRELIVHRAIYESTDARAIVHAHPVHTIARSLREGVIVPIDSEARYVLGEVVPVVSAEETIGSAEAAVLLADALKQHPVAVLRSHGVFARGATLEEAFYHVSCLEVACRILDIDDAAGGWSRE